MKYIFSFYGVIDLLSLIPSYIGIGIGANNISSIKSIRTIRLIRIFRILKLIRYVKEAAALKKAFIASKQRIVVFLFVVFSIVVLMGTIIYMLEDPKDGFTSIPRSIYWAIVTLTTVGYGDIAPQTPLGQFFASIIMILGYSIIAVPTGMISVELSKTSLNTQYCSACSFDNHEDDAFFCKKCEMIFSSKKALESLGIDKEKIKFELFTAPVKKAEEVIAETLNEDFDGNSKVTVICDDEEVEFDLNKDGDSILDAAMEQDLDVPFSCKGAVCCTCKAKVTKGKVIMDANYALSDQEVEDGYILSCQAHPATSEVTIDFDLSLIHI